MWGGGGTDVGIILLLKSNVNTPLDVRESERWNISSEGQVVAWPGG